jgi:hypothetical protein
VLGVGLGISLLVAYAGRRRFPEQSWMAAWMAVLWKLCDPAAATTAWPTFTAYTMDPPRYVILLSCLTGSVVLAKRGRRWWT